MNVDAKSALEIVYIASVLSVVALVGALILSLILPHGISKTSQAFVLFLGSAALLPLAVSQVTTLSVQMVGVAVVFGMFTVLLVPAGNKPNHHDALLSTIHGNLSPLRVTLKRIFAYQMKVALLLCGLAYVLLSFTLKAGVGA